MLPAATTYERHRPERTALYDVVRVERAILHRVRIALKRPFADGTTAVDLDPLSLLCRLAAAIPPPRYHTVKYAGVLASASPWRRRLAPTPKANAGKPRAADAHDAPKRGGYWPWARPARPYVRGRRPHLSDVWRTDAPPCADHR